jgi:signal transduction histidine kinase
VNDLLDVSRIESGRITLTVTPLNLPELAQDALADIQRRAQEENKPMDFVLDLAPDLPNVVGDQERISQVIGNLVSNGYNYTPENGKVTLAIFVNGDEVQLDVKDTGIGIDSKDQKRIFERFYRGEDPLVLATAGTGLGLAMAKILVEMHQGRIWFNSSGIRGEGSTFSFTLPINRIEE